MASITETAYRLAEILTSGTGNLFDPSGSDLTFFQDTKPLPLHPGAQPEACWAVDGGQALVADARCLQVGLTRVARALWAKGRCAREEQGELTAHLLAGTGGGAEGRRALAELGSPVAADAPVDLNLLRDWSEWALVQKCALGSAPGTIVLVDGDLEPDWRVPAQWLAGLLEDAARREVVLVGVTKHSSLARGGAPLIGQLELQADNELGARARWWSLVAERRPEVGPGVLVAVAKLDPDARFAFRFDLPADAPVEEVLGRLCPLADDAAFPGYPYPLSVADRLAACSGWERQEVWAELGTALATAGVPDDVRERAFADRHTFMERG